MRVKIGEIAEYCKFVDVSICHIPIEVTTAETDAFLAGRDWLEVPDDTFERIRESHLKQQKRDNEYMSISEHRIAGMEREKADELEDAVNEYAQSIALGLAAENDMIHAYRHSFNRIIIVLDKLKRYAEEADYIEKLLSLNIDDKDREKLTARLGKVKIKLEKQSRNG